MKRRSGSNRLQSTGTALVLLGLTGLAMPMLVVHLSTASEDLDRIGNYAGILAISLGAIGVALVLGSQLFPHQRTSRHQRVSRDGPALAADDLAAQVRSREGQRLTELLASVHPTTTAANLRYSDTRNDAEDGARSDTGNLDRDWYRPGGAAGAGDLRNIGRYFTDRTRERRLVVLGEAGTGKSVLALELMVQLLDCRHIVLDPRQRSLLPVPVWFSMVHWDATRPLSQWLATDLAAQFGLTEKLARAMLEAHRVLPILDGLDELDQPNAEPTRAIAAVRELNQCPAGLQDRPRPVVVTCRSEEYERLRAPSGVAIELATEVVVQPLDLDQIRDYLDREFRSPEHAEHRCWWNDALDRLAQHGDRRLLEYLQVPWRLRLAMTYQLDGGDPAELLPTADESVWADRNQNVAADPLLRRLDPLQQPFSTDQLGTRNTI